MTVKDVINEMNYVISEIGTEAQDWIDLIVVLKALKADGKISFSDRATYDSLDDVVKDKTTRKVWNEAVGHAKSERPYDPYEDDDYTTEEELGVINW